MIFEKYLTRENFAMCLYLVCLALIWIVFGINYKDFKKNKNVNSKQYKKQEETVNLSGVIGGILAIPLFIYIFMIMLQIRRWRGRRIPSFSNTNLTFRFGRRKKKKCRS
jgi:uncharacterized membrane protein YhaH (DUF805 family)